MARRVALATCGRLPGLDQDTQSLIEPLARRGIHATPAVWDDPGVDWTSFDLTIVRSCWDYVDRRTQFLEWAAGVPAIANPCATIAWNTDKRYLIDVAEAGVPVVSTTWLRRGDAWSLPNAGHWVIKPSVSIASLDSGRYRLDDPQVRRLASDHIERLHAQGRTVMLQPYMHAIDEQGETSLVYLGGTFRYAMRKAAVLDGPDIGVDRRFMAQGGLRLVACRPTADQLALADRALRAVPGSGPPLYARVDLIPGQQGRPVLLELELTEPQLYFQITPGAADTFAEIVAGALRPISVTPMALTVMPL